MSYLEDFNKLNTSTKGTIIIIACLMPFFIVSLYLFMPALFSPSVQFYIPLSFSICLSISWYLMTILLTILIVEFIDRLMNTKTDLIETFFITGVLSICYLSTIIIICFFCNSKFRYFVLIAYCYIVFRILWVLLVSSIYKRRAKKQKNKATILTIDPSDKTE